MRMRKTISLFLCIVGIVSAWILNPIGAYAKDQSEQLSAKIFQFDDKTEYVVTGSTPTTAIPEIGKLTLSGDYKKLDKKDGFEQYDVKSGVLSLSYSYDSSIISVANDKWHPYEDSCKKVNGISLDEKVKTGVFIVQTSNDGKKWVNADIQTNIFSVDCDTTKLSYSTKDIQLVNGCYYRILVAYEQEMVSGSKKIAFVDVDNKEYRRVVNSYEFYAVNSAEKSMSDVKSTPRKELGKRVGEKADTGFAQEITIDSKDPHYGWDLGTFSVNGYTRETTDNSGNSIFLKNAGDKVTLWFKLSQDIECLNKNEKLSIAEDKDGYDQYFEIPKTNFKHGALIVRYTDYEGVKHEPIIYTDFLAANATPGADTKAILFEEGDYEVALDYSVCKDEVIDSETDYRIFFKFSVRNGNTMFFPFDISTGAELRDNAVTPNGFMIDMAKSRYLNIDVRRTAIVEDENGHKEDVRFNRPAKDGDKYTEDGIYTVDITNQYTDEHTTKTFYVGSDNYLVAIAKTGKSVKELDEFINQGYTIDENGSLIAPIIEEPEPIVEELPEEKAQDAVEISDSNDDLIKVEENKAATDGRETKAIVDETTDADNDKEKDLKETEEIEGQSSGSKGIIVVISIIIVVIAFFGYRFFKKKKIEALSDSKEEEN